MVVYLSLIIAVAGILMYALSTNDKVKEIGRLSFACGLLAFLIRIADPFMNLGR
jgi:Na+/phosphate symporter